MKGNIPGNPVLPLHYITIAGHDFHERVPGIIVYVKMNTKGIREFRRFCEHHSMAIVVIVGGERDVVVCERGMSWDMVSVCGIGAWEVLGTAENLDRLTGNVSVVSWHEPIACSVHVRGSGAGVEKVKSKKPVPKDVEPGEWTVLHNEYGEALREGRLDDAANLLLKLGENTK